MLDKDRSKFHAWSLATGQITGFPRPALTPPIAVQKEQTIMERRQFIQLSAAGSVLGTTIASKIEVQAQEVEQIPTLAPGHPAVMAPRTDGVEIVWRVDRLAKGYVEFGVTPELGNVVTNDGWGLRPSGTEVIKVRLEALEPGTTYHYRAITETFDTQNTAIETSDLRTFRTLSRTASRCSFSVWNDTHKHNETIRQLHALTPPGDFLLWNGDISNDWNQAGEVAQNIITPAGGIDFTANSPLIVLRGNHDLRGTLAHQQQAYTATPDGDPWCVFRSGPAAIICLDTGEDKPDDHPQLFGRVACEPMRRQQAAWLAEVIERPEIKNAPYRLVFCHIPLRWTDEQTDHGYDHFSKRSRDLWHAPLVKWGAQLVISGHTHRDDFLPANEAFPYAQLVGGGPKMEQARLITGIADDKQLVITLTDMQGQETRIVRVDPIA